MSFYAGDQGTHRTRQHHTGLSEQDTDDFELEGTPVRVIFADQRLTMAGLADMMENMAALLTLGMATPYELMRPKARAKIDDSVVIAWIHKGSPLEVLMDLQGSVTAVTSVITLAGGVIALRPLYAKQLLKAAKADAEREREKLKRKISKALIIQFDELSKKKKKKLLRDKDFRRLLDQAAEGLMSIESISMAEAPESDSLSERILQRP